MTVQEVAKAVMKASGKTQSDVAEITGMCGQGAVAQLLRSKSMRVDSFLAILNACGYELVARSGDISRREFIVGEPVGSGESFEDMVRRIVRSELADTPRLDSEAIQTEMKF